MGLLSSYESGGGHSPDAGSSELRCVRTTATHPGSHPGRSWRTRPTSSPREQPLPGRAHSRSSVHAVSQYWSSCELRTGRGVQPGCLSLSREVAEVYTRKGDRHDGNEETELCPAGQYLPRRLCPARSLLSTS